MTLSNSQPARAADPAQAAENLDVFLLGPEEAVSCACRDCGDVHGAVRREQLYAGSIPHSLAHLTRDISPLLHEAIWHPGQIGVWAAVDAIRPLVAGMLAIRSTRRGDLRGDLAVAMHEFVTLMTFVEGYLAACRAHPTAAVSVGPGPDRPDRGT